MGSVLHRFSLPATLIAAAERVTVLRNASTKCGCAGDGRGDSVDVYVMDAAEIPLAPVRKCSLECLAFELIYTHGDDQRDTDEDVARVVALVESTIGADAAQRAAARNALVASGASL